MSTRALSGGVSCGFKGMGTVTAHSRPHRLTACGPCGNLAEPEMKEGARCIAESGCHKHKLTAFAWPAAALSHFVLSFFGFPHV